MPEPTHNTQQNEVAGPPIPVRIDVSPSATGVGNDVDQHEMDADEDE